MRAFTFDVSKANRLCLKLSTTKYKNGKKFRADYSGPYTGHDMRGGLNLAARKAGMSLYD